MIEVLEPKFQNPDVTCKGETRARVPLHQLRTLWINTGTLCNIMCRNCYIESSPTNDALVYMTAREVTAYLDEIEAEGLGTTEIGFTGGEPFLNPECTDMIEVALARGFEVLILTNAMRPMMRPKVQAALLTLKDRYGAKLTLRVSLDHFTQELHETERGVGTWTPTLEGIDWLTQEGFNIALAGRMCWGESEQVARAGYAELVVARGWSLFADNPSQLVLFPEMDAKADVPEISTSCWSILGKSPKDVMCASSRMVVKRKGNESPIVLPCTLLPFDTRFEMGSSLAGAARKDGGVFDQGAVKLAHPHCAKFCVLGGASCS